jgi:hypothetical protein
VLATLFLANFSAWLGVDTRSVSQTFKELSNEKPTIACCSVDSSGNASPYGFGGCGCPIRPWHAYGAVGNFERHYS